MQLLSQLLVNYFVLFTVTNTVMGKRTSVFFSPRLWTHLLTTFWIYLSWILTKFLLDQIWCVSRYWSRMALMNGSWNGRSPRLDRQRRPNWRQSSCRYFTQVILAPRGALGVAISVRLSVMVIVCFMLSIFIFLAQTHFKSIKQAFRQHSENN